MNIQPRKILSPFSISIASLGLLTILILLPVVLPLYASFTTALPGEPGSFTLQNYLHVFSDLETLTLLKNSILYATGGTIIALFYGIFFGWIVTRTNVPFRNVFSGLMMLHMVTPPFLKAIGYILLLSPTIGIYNFILNSLFGVTLNIYSMPGMMFCQGIGTAPMAFILMRTAMTNIDPSLEESAYCSGAGTLHTFRKIILPVIRPSILTAILLLFVAGMGHFTMPFFIGTPARIHVFSTAVYLKTFRTIPPNWGLGAAYATINMAISLTFYYYYLRSRRDEKRFWTMRGRGIHLTVRDLHGWKHVLAIFSFVILFLTLIMPILALFVVSLVPTYRPLLGLKLFNDLTLKNYVFAITHRTFSTAIKNSLLLSVVGASILMLVTSIIGYLVRLRVKGTTILDTISTLPLAVPAMSFGIGMLWMYLSLPDIGIYGTKWILLIGYVAYFFPSGLRFISGGLSQLHIELDESARVHGASWLTTFRMIVIPLLKTSFIGGWIYVFIHMIREVPLSLLFYSAHSRVVASLIVPMWEGGNLEEVAATNILILIFVVVPTMILLKVSEKKPGS